MTGPVTDLTALQAATGRLIGAVAALDGSAVAQPSLLPGWSRGHVLAHLARNADALVNVLAGRPMYVDATSRDADIERDASRPLAGQLTDLRDSAARLAAAAGRLTEDQWRSSVILRNGVTDLAANIPFRRQIEVELHHVDLSIGRTMVDLPAEFTDRALEYLARRFAGRADVPAVELRPEGGSRKRTGHLDGPLTVVSGQPWALVGWLSGRTDGGDLAAGSQPLPALPAL